MKKCLAILIGVALSAAASSQVLRLPISTAPPIFGRFFGQAGGTIGLDFSQFSGTVGHHNNPVLHKQVNYATLAIGGRFNVFEFSNTFSVALAAQPLISFGRAYNKSTGGGVNFMFRTPCTIDFNIGYAATNKSHASRRGVVIGAGMQWVKYPFFGGDIPVFKERTSGGQPFFTNMNCNWWEPVAHLGIRSPRQHFYSNEVNIRVAYVKRDSLNLNGASNTSLNNTLRDFERFSIMLSYLVFLNY
ncbi:MAG: hypothetical protein FWC39_04300 [Bacteroidetes bacterium]|nr:hypothetical protein [Bacteroidota bacterium]